MAQIGSLVVDLILKSATFNADMAKSARAVEVNTGRMQRSIASIEGGFTRAGNALKAFGAATAIAATSRALATLAKNAISVGDEIGDTATKLGVGTDYLQRLRFAAEQADVDMASLDAMFRQFQKTVATGKAPALAFEAVIAKVAEAKTQTEKVAIAFQYFGKQYQGALLLASAGTKTFADNMARAHTISEEGTRIADAATKQMLAIGNAVTTGFNDGFLRAFNTSLGDTGTKLKDVNQAMTTLGGLMGGAFSKTINLMAAYAKFASENPRLMSLMFSIHPGLTIDAPPKLPELSQDDPLFKPDPSGADPEAEGAERLAAAKTAAAAAQKALNEQQALYKTLLEGSRTPQEDYAAALAKITKAHADGELGSRLHTMAAANLANSYLGLASTAVGALGTLFKDSKGVAIAQAVINTAQAITATLAQYGATPWGLAAAGVAAAAGAAQIATIMSTSTGSGKKPAVGASSSAAKTASGAGKGSSGRGMGQAVTINLQGQGGFSREQVRELAGQLNGLVADGATIRTMG
jgi:hypothetical protein